MILLSVDRVRPGHEQQVRDWFAQLHGPRREDVLESLRAEGVDHERVALVPTADGLLVVYAMESDDFERARTVFEASTLPVDLEHRRVLGEALTGSAEVTQEVVLDVVT